MRPRKGVLLLMRNEEELGQWRMKLEIWGYHVYPCATLDEALSFAGSRIDAAATSIPGSVTALAERSLRVLLFDVGPHCALGLAARVEPRGPVLPERVRDAIRVLAARKRGPAKKPPASVRPEDLETRAA